ncbi:type II toxin-antitoxin system RatA family toxin [Aliiroseovarius crassostreae]|uniref:type II toxin-antitoxin system RatA family toxin n=1 Tax=Aliiroseovarius crassostreae TaxID=154981 RepID=UPI00220EC70D|nr:type II toxin-antitoxin system RatA family toxin [Aliiroseovarius crassostreae]UWP99708.1 type II toxin-antitoxin system RatA family toxin [Aliiroseovarius crassostreae]UWQ12252.1 type II toxin-antitoxin system RatA family toxin [Aliiroseovarius crassostreae]
MPTHGEKRILPYTPNQMYELVADVAKYPQFLPWNSAARVRKRTPQPDGTEVIEADLVISFKVFRERFGSRALLDPNTPRLDMEYLDGPFKYLRSHWQFHPHETGCEIEFFVDFEFKSAVLQKVIGLVFNEAMQRIVRAFELRAQELYGPAVG